MRDFATVKKWASQRVHKFVVTYRQGGKRQVRYFKDEKGARDFAQEKTIELRNEGRRHEEITHAERRAVLRAREKGVDLGDAVEHFCEYLETLNSSAAVTIEAAADEFLSIRAAEGKSAVYIHDLRCRLRAFARAFGERFALSVATREIDAWLLGLALAPQSRVNYRRVLFSFFVFCVGRGYCKANPVASAAKVKVPPGVIGIPRCGRGAIAAFRLPARDSARSGNRHVRRPARGRDRPARLGRH
jgi:hypothetical protein